MLVSIASSVCIDIIDSPEGRAAVNDFWLTSPGHIREVVENAAETSYALGYYWGQMKSNAYKEVATALRNYFYQGTDIQTDIAVVHTTTPYLQADSENNFSVALPYCTYKSDYLGGYPQATRTLVDLGGSSLFLCNYYTPSGVAGELPMGFNRVDDEERWSFSKLVPNDVDLVCYHLSSSRVLPLARSEMLGQTVDVYNDLSYSLEFFSLGDTYIFNNSKLFEYGERDSSHWYNLNYTIFKSDGVLYDLKSVSAGYALVDFGGSGEIYQNRTWSSIEDFMRWYLALCGLVNCSIPYSPHNTISDESPVTIPDIDNTDSRIDDIPDSDEYVQLLMTRDPDLVEDLKDNPDVVLYDPGDEDTYPEIYKKIYTSDLMLPTVKTPLWAQKFPFCIPFDFYKMFTGLRSEAITPEFNFVVLPENSFGLTNDEITVDVNFSDFETIAKISRFFLGALFLLGLILLTRKMIGGGD